MSEKIFLRNPHSALAAIRNRPRDVLSVSLGSKPNDAWKAVEAEARRNSIAISDKIKFGEVLVQPKRPIELFEVIKGAPRESGVSILVLDCIQDPQNLGAIFRAAAFFGVSSIVLTQERSAPVSSIVYDVSAGGVETIDYAFAGNLARALSEMKEAGFWILGTSEHEASSLDAIQQDRSWVVVVGNEESGLRRLTLEKCDLRCAISPKGPVTSLNVASATSVVLFHLCRSN